ncbi:MAG TPA: creatininase family protein, partial [Beijerinckiaceae bacterium]
MRQARRALLVALLLAAPPAGAQSPPRSLHLRDLTWMEVRDAIAAGHVVALAPTGGVEQNGPHMALDKHDRIVARAAERIAAAVGGALVAPVVSFAPEGDHAPPTGNMRWPGTIGLTEPVFEGVLDNLARSLKQAGFKAIFFIGDHGQSQAAQARVAERLTREWARAGVVVR